jgi:hypothetical protein
MTQVLKSDDIGKNEKWGGKVSVDDKRRKLLENRKKKK